VDNAIKKRLLNYCVTRGRGSTWAASVIGIVLDCDFRESEKLAEEWLNKERFKPNESNSRSSQGTKFLPEKF